MRQHELGLLQTASAFLVSQTFKRLSRKRRNVSQGQHGAIPDGVFRGGAKKPFPLFVGWNPWQLVHPSNRTGRAKDGRPITAAGAPTRDWISRSQAFFNQIFKEQPQGSHSLDQGGIRQPSCTRFVDPPGNIRLRTCFAVVVPGFDKRKIRIDGTSVCVEGVGSQAKLLSHSQPLTGMNGSG
jgi:hypothetical protein